MKKSILVISAHPDDEILGCGGTIAKHADCGDDVHICLMVEGITSRQEKRNRNIVRTKLEILSEASKNAANILGAKSIQTNQLPDNRLDSMDRLDLIKIIEKYVDVYKPDFVYTHHSGDLNVDHRRLHEAVITACRPLPNFKTRRILSYEVSSSTEWQTASSSMPFNPNWFVNISNQLDRKLKALAEYKLEMRDWPHSRSIKAVEHLARLRGSQVGVEAAEAFILLRSLEHEL